MWLKKIEKCGSWIIFPLKHSRKCPCEICLLILLSILYSLRVNEKFYYDGDICVLCFVEHLGRGLTAESFIKLLKQWSWTMFLTSPVSLKFIFGHSILNFITSFVWGLPECYSLPMSICTPAKSLKLAGWPYCSMCLAVIICCQD